jgi:hypothetical protein
MKASGVAEEDPLTGEIIGAAIEVHRFFGPGRLESVCRAGCAGRSTSVWPMRHRICERLYEA